MFPWCSGYHVCLTRRRSPVRSWAETNLFFSDFLFFDILDPALRVDSDVSLSGDLFWLFYGIRWMREVGKAGYSGTTKIIRSISGERRRGGVSRPLKFSVGLRSQLQPSVWCISFVVGAVRNWVSCGRCWMAAADWSCRTGRGRRRRRRRKRKKKKKWRSTLENSLEQLHMVRIVMPLCDVFINILPVRIFFRPERRGVRDQ